MGAGSLMHHFSSVMRLASLSLVLLACGCGALTKSPAHFADVPLPAEVPLSDTQGLYEVRGEVRSPGRQLYLGPIKLSQAIKSAGGATKSANLRYVKVQRADGTIEYYNLVKEPYFEPEVFPRDRVEVIKKSFSW